MKVRLLLSGVAIAALTACGGGGGGGSPAPVAITPAPVVASSTPTPAPTVSVLISKAKTTVGAPVTVSWTSTNATSCVGLDGMSGVKALNNQEQITPAAGGQYTYTVSCDGDGGTVKQSVALVVPIPVATNSYANWKEIGVSATTFPQESYINAGATNGPMAYGWADFFHTGSRDLFTAHTNFYAALWDNTIPTADKYTTITNNQKYYSDFQFWHLNNDGTYTKLWQQKGCKAPRKALVADFNGDGYADVFVACHDVDAEAGLTTMRGEYAFMVLSDGKGGFTSSAVANTLGFYHGAAAADFNNDGYPDIVLSNVLLINNKDGTFTPASSGISNAILPGQEPQYYSFEALDVDGDGKMDVIAGGDEQMSYGNPLDITTAIYYGDGTGHFNRYAKIPKVAGRGLVLDFTVVTNNGVKSLYVGRTSGPDSGLTGSQCYSGTYCANTLQWVNLATMESTVILDLITPPQTWNDRTNFPMWWIPVKSGNVNGVGTFNTFAGDNLIHFITH
jgi:hypothetical protein